MRSKALPLARDGQTVTLPYVSNFSAYPDNRKEKPDKTITLPDIGGQLTDIITDKLSKAVIEFFFT